MEANKGILTFVVSEIVLNLVNSKITFLLLKDALRSWSHSEINVSLQIQK